MTQAATTMTMPGVDTSSLTHRTARGFAWMSSQALVAKVVTTIGQIIIAWFLLPEDFGLASLAYMFSIIPVMIQQGGLREVVIARHAHFKRWANAAFWMSMALGLAGGLLMAGIAPIAAGLYHQPTLLGLLLIIAALFPLDSISTIPIAHIHGQMRFRLAAAIYLMQAVIQTGLTVLFAAMGFGAYSIILPRLFTAAATAIICWSTAPIPVRPKLQFKRWRYLIGDGATVITATACDLALTYVAYLILSVLNDTRIVGLYAFAVGLSTQAAALITYQLGGVLFPALSTLQNQPERQGHAFLRAVQVLACLAIPVCLLQAALADPVVHLFFPQRWWETVTVIQILSIGMAMRAVGWPSVAMIQAQQRFKARLALAIVSVLSLSVSVTLGAMLDGIRGAAIGTAVQMAIMETATMYVAVHRLGQGWPLIRRALWPPMLLAVLAVGPATLLAWWIGPVTGQHWWRLGVIIALSGVSYLMLFGIVAPQAWAETRSRFHVLLARFSAIN